MCAWQSWVQAVPVVNKNKVQICCFECTSGTDIVRLSTPVQITPDYRPLPRFILEFNLAAQEMWSVPAGKLRECRPLLHAHWFSALWDDNIGFSLGGPCVCASVCDSWCESPPPLYFLVRYQVRYQYYQISGNNRTEHDNVCVCLESAPLTQRQSKFILWKKEIKENQVRGCDSCILSNSLAAETGG